MNKEQAEEMHILLFTFMGSFHEKFLVYFRQHQDFPSQLKKNQTKIISILYHHEGLTSTELGKMLDIEKGGLTTIIDQLEHMGLVTRSPDPHDRRKQQLLLSPAGRAEMDKVMDSYTESLINMFKDVDQTQLLNFMDSLRFAVNFMQEI